MDKPALDAVIDELRDGDDPWLVARRRIATIAAALAAECSLLGLAQYGVIRRLPDPPGFDSNAVMTSRSAYPLGVPDAALAVTGLGGVIALATARGSRRTGRGRWLDAALGGALVIGSGAATAYLAEMIARQRRLCAYCIAGAGGFYAMLGIAVRALRRA